MSLSPLVYLPLTRQPDNALLSPSTSNSLTYDANLGLSFTDSDGGIGSKKYLTVPIPQSVGVSMSTPSASSVSKSMTICFNLCLTAYTNANSLRVFTQGDLSKSGSEYNRESIHIDYGANRKLNMTITDQNQTSTTLVVNTALVPFTWYFIAYTITETGSNTKVTFYVRSNTTSNFTTPSNTDSFTTTFAVGNIRKKAMLFKDVRVGDRFANDGWGLNGYIRDFMILDTALNMSQITALANTLPSPPAAGATSPPIFPVLNCAASTALQTLMGYSPPPDVKVPMTDVNILTKYTNNLTMSNVDTSGSNNGLIFVNSSSPTLSGVTTNKYINIPYTSPSNNIFTIYFSLYLSYLNTNILRILTLGNTVNNVTSEVFGINSVNIRNASDNAVSNTSCSNTNTNTNRQYLISATVNNTPKTQTTIVNQSPSVKISSVNGYSKTGQIQRNVNIDGVPAVITPSSTTPEITPTPMGLAQFPTKDTVTVMFNSNSDFFNKSMSKIRIFMSIL
jgi:hypothetical protein